MADHHLLIIPTDDDTSFHQPAKMNAREAFLLVLRFKSVYDEECAALNR